MFLQMGLGTMFQRELAIYTSMGSIWVNFRAELSGYRDLMGLDVCMDIIAINFDPFLSQNYLRAPREIGAIRNRRNEIGAI